MSAIFSGLWTPSTPPPPLSVQNSCNLPSFGQNLANPLPPPQCRRHMYIVPYHKRPRLFNAQQDGSKEPMNALKMSHAISVTPEIHSQHIDFNISPFFYVFVPTVNSRLVSSFQSMCFAFSLANIEVTLQFFYGILKLFGLHVQCLEQTTLTLH